MGVSGQGPLGATYAGLSAVDQGTFMSSFGNSAQTSAATGAYGANAVTLSTAIGGYASATNPPENMPADVAATTNIPGGYYKACANCPEENMPADVAATTNIPAWR